jgi:hypothetical protein
MWAFACILGIVIGILFEKWKSHRGRYSGTILVTESEEKTLYSLELDEYPEQLKFKKEVVFRVDASEKSHSQIKHRL